jgi:hypothetical protein
MMNIKNLYEDINLMPLFRAKALVLFGCLKPRPKVRGNSNHE